jgi:hypothetical protein
MPGCPAREAWSAPRSGRAAGVVVERGEGEGLHQALLAVVLRRAAHLDARHDEADEVGAAAFEAASAKKSEISVSLMK